MAPKTPRGVIAAIATAVDQNGDPDCARSIALARYLLAHGCDGLNVLGTTGEATSFSVAQRQTVMNAYAGADLPLSRCLVGTGAAALADAITLTAHAAELGFGGALLLPPFYYKDVADDGLFAFVERIMAATAAQPIPLYLYHFPALSTVPWPLPLVGRMIEAFGPRLRGLKDSSGDMGYARAAAGLGGGLQRISIDRRGARRGAGRTVRRLHLGNREPQFRSMRARLSSRRRRGPGAGSGDPPAARRQAGRCGRQGAPRAHPCRPRLGAGRAAAERPAGRRPDRRHRRLRPHPRAQPGCVTRL